MSESHDCLVTLLLKPNVWAWEAKQRMNGTINLHIFTNGINALVHVLLLCLNATVRALYEVK